MVTFVQASSVTNCDCCNRKHIFDTHEQTNEQTDEGTVVLLELLSQLKRQFANETYLQGGVKKVGTVLEYEI